MFDLESALIALAFSVLLMTVVWTLHLKDGDASIVDPVWGPTIFGIGAVYGLAIGATWQGARLLVLLMAGAWALRLGVHLAARHRRQGEDRRYRKMREARGEDWWWRSYYVVFLLQAALAWVVAMPLMAAVSGPRSVGIIGALGFVISAFGFVFEAVADGQLAAFMRKESGTEPAAGQEKPSGHSTNVQIRDTASGAESERSGRGVMDRGLWRFSRHPNYFGESVVWWGIALVAISQGAFWALPGPVLITFMLLKVSGITMTEEDIADRRPAYRAYVKSTSAFFPRPPTGP